MNLINSVSQRPLLWLLRTSLLCCGAALYLFLQIPGCTPEPPGIGGATETIMEEGPLVPVTLRFLDGGAPTPVRMYLSHRDMNYVLGPSVGYYFPIFSDLYYMSKYFPIRPEIPVLDMQFSSDHHYYFLNGEATVGLVLGPYTVIAYKGLEYRPMTAAFDVAADPITREFTMERWIDMPSKGWYNGDDHMHLARNGREDPIYLALQEADDLHVGNYLQLQRKVQAAVQTTWGKTGEARRNHAILRSGEEPRSSFFGHVLLLGIDRLILPVSQGALLDHAHNLVKKLTADMFEEARAAGGLAGYAHGDGANTHAGLAVDIPRGVVDFIEIFQFGKLNKPELWYAALSAGFRIPPSAGSDFPANIGPPRSIPRLVPPMGADRMYVQVDGAFTYETWQAGLKAGRVLLTNGPMVDIRINDQGPGGEVRIDDNAQGVTLNATVEHWRPMKESRLIANGRTLQTWANTEGRTRWEITSAITLDKSAWIALHVLSDSTGTTGDNEVLIQAHTAPIYVLKGAQPIRDAAGIQMLINQVETCRATYTSADWQYVDTRIKDRLIQRCDEALTEYRERLAMAQE